MSIKINKEMLQSFDLNKDILAWYEKNGSEDLLNTLIKLNEDDSARARLIYIKMMNHRQRAEIAAYAAKSVLSIFEKKAKKNQIARMSINVANNFAETGKIINYHDFARGIAYYTHLQADNICMYTNSHELKDAATAGNSAAWAAAVAEEPIHKSEDNAYYAIDDAVKASYDSNKLELRLIRKAVKILERDSKNSTNSLSEKSQALIALA
jgi:hypothetical protein